MHELLENFGINWKLLIAQVVNFAILFFVLRRFAYGPIIRMLEERRVRIKEGLEAGAEGERKLAQATNEKEKIMSGAKERAVAIVSEAESLALEKEADMLRQAHEKAESVIASAEKAIHAERGKQMEEVFGEAEALVRAATAKVLSGLEPDRRDSELIRQALEELKVASKKL